MALYKSMANGTCKSFDLKVGGGEGDFNAKAGRA